MSTFNYKERVHDLSIQYKKETDKATKDEIRDLITIYRSFSYATTNK